jgi:uncharacterized protein
MADDLRPKCMDWLIEVLGCPACEDRPPLEKTDAGLRCDRCGRVYPVVDGLPILVTDRATGSAEKEPEEGALRDES